jgi:hypothetical protein
MRWPGCPVFRLPTVRRTGWLLCGSILPARVPKWSAVKAWGLGSPSATGSSPNAVVEPIHPKAGDLDDR